MSSEEKSDAPETEKVEDTAKLEETPAAAEETPAAAEDDTMRSTTYSPPAGGEKIVADDEEENILTEKVVAINRCAKVVKGGRRFSFSALVVAGDQSGNVGYGFGKANVGAECIRKASDAAKTALLPIKMRGTTIPHETICEFGGGKVMLRPD